MVTIGGWTAEDDASVLDAVLNGAWARVDPLWNLTWTFANPLAEHTLVLAGPTHGYRDSMDYALFGIEAAGEDGDIEPYVKIVRTVLRGQDLDPESRTYGVWPYCAEDALAKNPSPDYNWADFLGSLLVLLERRHGNRLPADLRADVRESIRHAAAAIRRRDVDPRYTNIVALGSFVTSLAAEILGDEDLLSYARTRVQRWAATIDETASFHEFNSPTYWIVTMLALARIRWLVEDAEIRAVIERIWKRGWLHIAQRWHAPINGLAGPMSRSYELHGVRRPELLVLLQKATGDKLHFFDPQQPSVARDLGLGEATQAGHVAMTPMDCPADILATLTGAFQPHEIREWFGKGRGVGGRADGARVGVNTVGTTWLGDTYALGSLNQADTWLQRRPAVAHWNGRGTEIDRSVDEMRLRVMKDDHDFTSGVMSTVQWRDHLAFVVAFAPDGGDRHMYDRSSHEKFTAHRLDLICESTTQTRVKTALRDGEEVRLPCVAEVGQRVSLAVDGALLSYVVAGASWGGRTPTMAVLDDGACVSIQLRWLDGTPTEVSWEVVGQAFAAGAFSVRAGTPADLVAWDAALRSADGGRVEPDADGMVDMRWHAPQGPELKVRSTSRMVRRVEHAPGLETALDGEPTPLTRLSSEPVAP